MSDTTDTTGGIAPYTKDALDEKIVREFPGKIVRKDLTSLMKRGCQRAHLRPRVPAGHVLLHR